jgi:hypothetical protein
MNESRRAPLFFILFVGFGCLSASGADNETPPGRQAPQPPPLPPPPELLGWSHEFHPGLFFTSVYVSDDPERSPDATIQGSADSIAYRVVFDGALAWRGDTSALDQTLHLAYGRVHQEGAGWQESLDELRYDGVFRRDIIKPTFAYRSWGAETVFTNVDDDTTFDPIRVYGSWGIGQLYKNWFPGDAFEWRLGVRLQKSWGSDLSDEQERWLLGPEALLRYERTIDDLRSFFAMYEGWSEFSDLRHTTSVITAGLKFRLATYLALELGLRMYYEARPTGVESDETDYSRWFIRQDTMIGLDAVF